MVIALLGILKAGGAYVPLDARLPGERLRFMVEDVRPRVVLTKQNLWRESFGKDAIILDGGWATIAQENTANTQIVCRPRNLAYVMYTSGSTGKPKGVPVEHRGVVNLLASMQRAVEVTCDDVLLAVTTLSFDIAGLEVYLPLISGAQLVIASGDDIVDGRRLRDLLIESKATVMQATPATWRLLIAAGWQGSPNLKILCGGETFPRELAKDLTARSNSVWNVYGPTETTIWSSIDTDRPPHCQYIYLHIGQSSQSCASECQRRNLHWRRWTGPRVSEPAGVDGGTLRHELADAGTVAAFVSHRRPG